MISRFQACFEAMEKTALLERLVRLGATPIPGTPKLLMKSRTPGELRALQGAVEAGWNKRVTNPIMQVASKGLSKIPEGRGRRIATHIAQAVAKDPVGTIATELIPVPGVGIAYQGLKKGLEKGIDHFIP